MTLRTLAAAVAAGGLAATAHAQPPAPAPQVVRFPGGVVVQNGREVIVRQAGPAGTSANLVTGSGNGFGNTIVVGGGGGVTVVSGSRNGVGNRLVVDPTDLLLDLDLDVPELRLPQPKCRPPVAPPPAEVQRPEPPVVRGRQTEFWTARQFSDAHDCNLYWHPGAKAWYRYHADDDTYRPAPNPPAAPDAP